MLVLVGIVETRKIFGGENRPERIIFYILALVAIVIFFYGLVLKVKKYFYGRPLSVSRWRSDKAKRQIPEVTKQVPISSSIIDVAAHRTLAKRHHGVGLSHLFVFWGFLGLLAATTILSLDYDIYGNITRLFFGHQKSFFVGTFYLVYNALFDTAGVIAIVGVVVLLIRRIASKDVALDYSRVQVPEAGYSRTKMLLGDYVFIVGLLLILITGFLIQGLRIDASNFPSFEKWAYVGYMIGRMWSLLGISHAAAASLHQYLWWLHILMALAFVAYLPWSKAFHMISAPANLALRNPARTRRLSAALPDTSGYMELSDFTSKELVGFDACTKCGRCHSVCPARTAGAPLSPRDFILDLRQWADRARKIPAILDWEERATPSGPLLTQANPAGGVIPEETLWSCTTCMACVEICPVGIEHVPTIVSLRRSLVAEGNMEPSLQAAMKNITTQGNSFGKSSRMRARWTKGLDIDIKDARKEHVEYLWFLGDFASFDERLAEVSRTLAKVLDSAGVSFGILFEDEQNAGNDVRRVGEEGLFEMLVEKNMDAFSRASFDKIFTTDPHSFNTLRNEYPEFGLDKPVLHYSELLVELLYTGRVVPQQLGKIVTYHDPCYLGRYNRIFDAPRDVVRLTGCKLIEMGRNRDNSFCCGAGGGRIWMDDSNLKERPSANRIREAAALDVDFFVVACPKDYAMFSDAVKTTGNEDKLKVVDIVELFAEATGLGIVSMAGSLEGVQDGA